MQREIGAIIFACFLQNSFSQEKSITNQAYIDPFLINPACAGSEIFTIVRLSVDKHLTGFSESPATMTLTGNTRAGSKEFYTSKGLVNKNKIKIDDRVGLGGNLYYDKNGPLNNVGGMLAYAHHIPVNRISALSLGLAVNMMNKSLNMSELEPQELNDEYLFNEQYEYFQVSFGLGAYYYTKQFFTGISVINLLPVSGNGNSFPAKSPSYFVITGYKFNGRILEFEPSVIINKLSGENLNFSIFTRIYYLRYNWVSLSYNAQGYADIMAALKLYNSFYLGYNYVYTLGRIVSYNYGSHRISLGINLGLRGIKSSVY